MQSPDLISTKAGKEAPRSCLEDQNAPWNASFLTEVFIQYLLILRLYFSQKLTQKPGMGGGGVGCEGNRGQAPSECDPAGLLCEPKLTTGITAPWKMDVAASQVDTPCSSCSDHLGGGGEGQLHQPRGADVSKVLRKVKSPPRFAKSDQETGCYQQAIDVGPWGGRGLQVWGTPIPPVAAEGPLGHHHGPLPDARLSPSGVVKETANRRWAAWEENPPSLPAPMSICDGTSQRSHRVCRTAGGRQGK